VYYFRLTVMKVPRRNFILSKYEIHMPRIRIKICCMASIEEARTAIKYGADALGFVSAMPSGAGIIDEELIPIIVSTVPPPIATFLLTSKVRTEDIIPQILRCKTNTLQLVDSVDTDVYEKIHQALPWIKIVQVIHVRDGNSIKEAEHISKFVDAILLDSGNQSLEVKELGGTGRVHDWSISKAICERIEKPVFLAGGLNPDNVKEAIETVRPFGVDVCSRLRTDGHLDTEKLKQFISAVRSTLL
jgi:phosphoribosylanthranilate isomerase